MALAIAAGCAEVDDAASVDEAATVAAHRPPASIVGAAFNRHRLTGGRVRLAPVDLSATAIEAQVERDGGFDVHPGAGTADGILTVPGVPRGPYWLRVGTNFFLTRERFVDVGVDVLGRPDAIPAASGTGLVFDVDGLVPVSSGDDFQLEAPDAQVGFYSTLSASNPILANAPAPGDTALAGALFPFAEPSQYPLIQASRGDTLTLAQLTPRQLGDLTYLSLSRALTTSVEMIQGGETRITGTLTAPPAGAARVELRQDAFEAMADDVRAGAVPSGASFIVDVSPGGQRVNLGTPDLALLTLPAGHGDTVLPVEFGNPYPASFPLFTFTSVSFQAPFQGIDESGALVERQRSSSIFAWEFVERGRATLAPLLAPVRDIAIDGRGPSDHIRTTSATPVLSWDRPRRGRPDAYQIRVVRVIGVAPFTQAGIARLVVGPDVRRVRIPAGVLQPGEHYLFRVAAIKSSQPRTHAQLDIMFVPPHAQVVDAFSDTIRVAP